MRNLVLAFSFSYIIREEVFLYDVYKMIKKYLNEVIDLYVVDDNIRLSDLIWNIENLINLEKPNE